MIDHFLISLISILPMLFWFNSFVDHPDSMFTAFPFFLLLFFCLHLLKDSIQGRSLGKRLVGISVRSLDGMDASLKSLVLRNLFSVVWPVDLILLLVSEDQRKLGDRIAETAVFTEDRRMGLPLIIILPICGALIFIGIIFTTVISVMKNNASYKTSEQFIKENPEIRAYLGRVVSFGFIPTGGFMVSNGAGEAEFDIKVKGSKKNARIQVSLYKDRDSDWRVTAYQIRK
jgi:uncharacterized RDD family membrane protein YckC